MEFKSQITLAFLPLVPELTLSKVFEVARIMPQGSSFARLFRNPRSDPIHAQAPMDIDAVRSKKREKGPMPEV